MPTILSKRPGGSGNGSSTSDFYSENQFARYVDYDNGSDSNDGLAPRKAMKTIQAAYDELIVGRDSGDSVGTIIALPGDHNVGTGVNFQNIHPVTVTSLAGDVANRQSTLATSNGEARIYTTGSPTNGLFNITTPSGTANGYGFTFLGLSFDLGQSVKWGIYGVNANKVLVRGNVCQGPTTPNIEQSFCRGLVDTTHGDDCSFWRILYNSCYHVGICKMGNFTGGAQNCNQHVIAFNIGNFGSALSTVGIDIFGGTRCVTIGNNLEGAGADAGIRVEQTRQSAFIGDGGEGVTPFVNAVGSTANNGNIFAPLGIPENQSGKVLLTDGNQKRNKNISDFLGWTVGYAENVPVTDLKTGTYSVAVTDQLIRCDSTSAGFTVTLPTAVNAYGERHLVRNYGTANAVTVASAGGSITGITSIGVGGFVNYMSDGSSWYAWGNAGVAGTASWSRLAATYSSSITPNVADKSAVSIAATDTNAFTINAPTGMVDGQIVTFIIRNASGGTLGNVTFDGASFLDNWSNVTDKPANGNRTTITYTYQAGAAWVMMAKAVDIS